ncbi:DUF1631 family protein [Pleionea sediminis]|uniref:DUF1631 family protein n=1 Tax=Pleionea sediminis TaxID=2569479 RepID=UPI001185F467|nr:DUF1631 family protein [Pleionea sediminis]
MKSGFPQINNKLQAYVSRFSEAVSSSSSTERQASIEDSELWQRFLSKGRQYIQQEVSSEDGIKQSPHLYIFNQLVELLTSQILPFVKLSQKQERFVTTFHVWFVRFWLEYSKSGNFPFEFQMVIEFMCRVLKPYDLNAGRTFENLVEEFATCFEKSVQSSGDAASLQKLQQSLTKKFQEFKQKVRPFEERVIAFEKQQVTNETANQKAKKLILKKASEAELPDWVYQFLFEHWQRYFHLNLLKEDDESSTIKNGERVLERLIKVLSYRSFEDVQQAIGSEIAPVWSDIRELFNKIVIDESILDGFLEQLEGFHLAILEGRENDCLWITVESLDSDEEQGGQRLSSTLAQFKLGSWFLYNKQGQQYRCYVAHRDTNTGHVVFVNYSGARVEGLNVNVLEDALEKKRLIPISLESELDHRISDLGQYIEQQTQIIDKQIEERNKVELKKQVMARLEKSKQQRMQARQSREDAERRAREKQEQLNRQEKIKQLTLELQSLTPGSTYIDHQNNEQIIQFVLRLKHSGKLVFVDKSGVKAAQWSPEEMATLVTDGQVELLASRQSNEQTMEQIVAAQRMKRQETAEKS